MAYMTGLERIRAMIAGEGCDHLPIQPMLMLFAGKHAGIPFDDYCRDGRLMAEAQIACARDYNIDVLLTCSDPAREVIDIAGEDSIEWFFDQPPAINECRAALTDKKRLASFTLPDPLRPGRMNDRIRGIELMRAAGTGRSIVGWVEGPLALAAELRGINNIMTDFLDDPEFVERLLDFTAGVAIVYGKAQVEAGADTIGMSDAAASLMGPTYYHRFLLPRQMRVLSALRSYGCITRLHMCGKTDSLMTGMATLPVDIYEIDFPADLAAAKRLLGEDKIILGNVSTIGDLLNGDPQQVARAAARCHKICGRRHVVGAGCEVSPMTPVDNLRALVQYGLDHQP